MFLGPLGKHVIMKYVEKGHRLSYEPFQPSQTYQIGPYGS
jgi:hypothetical protein